MMPATNAYGVNYTRQKKKVDPESILIISSLGPTVWKVWLLELSTSCGEYISQFVNTFTAGMRAIEADENAQTPDNFLSR
jgi:hypothetical protein